MMQAADSWNLDHRTERGRLDGSADRCIFFDRQMRAAPFVVFEIVLQDPAQPAAWKTMTWSKHSRRMDPIKRSA